MSIGKSRQGFTLGREVMGVKLPVPRAAGERGVILYFGEVIDPEIFQRVRKAMAAIVKANLPGLEDMVPGFASLTLYYDPEVTSYQQMVEAIKGIELEPDQSLLTRRWFLPVLYGGEEGPDLETVARYHGLPQDEVVHLHSSGDYLIYMVGFAPGFPYLGGLPAALATPRRATPRPRIVPGSVGIGGEQTGIYPLATPGGWHIIGRIPFAPYRPERQPPVYWQAGDRIRFFPVTPKEYALITREDYAPEWEWVE